MKDNKIYLKWGLLAAIAIFLLPLIIDHLIIGNNFPSNIENDEWVSFLGNYIGAIIGAFVTLVGIKITIKFTNDQNKEERRLSVAPHFKYTMCEESQLHRLHDVIIFMNPDENSNTKVNATIKLKNVGKGPGLEMLVSNISFDDTKKEQPVLIGSDGIVGVPSA